MSGRTKWIRRPNSTPAARLLCVALCFALFLPFLPLVQSSAGATSTAPGTPGAPAAGLPDLNFARRAESPEPKIAPPGPSDLPSHSPYTDSANGAAARSFEASDSLAANDQSTATWTSGGSSNTDFLGLYAGGAILLSRILGTYFSTPKPPLSAATAGYPAGAPVAVAPQSSSYSLALNGTTAYATIPNSSTLNITSSITVEAWIKYPSLPAANAGIAERYRDVATPDGGFALRLLTTGKIRFYLLKNGFDHFSVASNASVPIGGWHHIAGVFNGTTARIFIDGVLDISKATTFTPGTGSSEVFIGRTPGGGFFNGLIDEVRVTAGAVYSANFTPETQLGAVTGTRGLWKFNSQTVSDSSGNGNNGSVAGGATFSTDVPGGANQPPTVSITSPANGATFTAPVNITINASAADSDGSVSKVDFYSGTTLLGTDTTAPYSFTWNNVPATSYSLTAKATDNLGAETTSTPPVGITVNPDPGNPPPTVSITSPANGATFTAPANITIDASASDSHGINKVEFFVAGTTQIGAADTTAPYSVTWNNPPIGTHSLTAKATDNLGAFTTSPAVLITVNSGSGQTPFNGPHNVPGLTQAEDFDNGGEGVAYHDNTPTNEWGFFYRPTDVDILGPTADTGGGFELANVYQGEWLEYTINVTTSQTYDIQARIASGGPGGIFHYDFDNGAIVTSGVTVPNTGDWGAWQTVTKTGVFLSAGQHVMRVVMDANGGQPVPAVGNFNYFNFVAGGSPPPVYDGFHDGADCNWLIGWAWDQNQPNTPINVDIFSDNNLILEDVPANQFRQDLLNAQIGNGVHGFMIATPTSLHNGVSHSITVKIANTSINLNSTPRTILCGAPPAGGFQAALADPANRTGSGGEDLFSGNFNWSMPILGLSGRAGLGVGVTLSYNSLVWTRSGQSIKFNADNGFPSPGFRVGFPVIQAQKYTSVSGSQAYLMVMPSGSRVELRAVGGNLYQAADSSYLQLIEMGPGSLLVRATDGSKHTYVLGSDANEFECTRIEDRNGNFITITYNGSDRITAIIDTLGRIINFLYTGTSLTSITQAWKDGAHTWATFIYENRVIQSNYPGLTVIGPAQAIPTLKEVGLDDGSRVTFDYTPWGQVHKITNWAADNHELNHTSYNLPQTLSQQSNCPRFTNRSDFAENWNGNVPVGTDFFYDPAEGRGDVTLIDGTVHKEFFATTGFRRGLTTRMETWSGGALKKSTTVTWTQDNEAFAYSQNPRPTETNVSDESGNLRRTGVTYTSVTLPNGTACNLPTETLEYGPGGASVLRKSVTAYELSSAYLDNHIVGLVRDQFLYDGASGPLMSKVTYEYDLVGEFMVNQGAPVQYTDVGYIVGRGNRCVVRRWDVSAPTDINQSIQVSRTGYNTTGSPVFVRDALGHQSTISYTDSFLEGAGSVTLAYPTTVTDADGFSGTSQYRRDIGTVTRTQDPKGAFRNTTYDLAGRVQRIDISNGAYTVFDYPLAQTSVGSRSLLQAGAAEFTTTQVFDGAGRTLGTATAFPGSVGGFRAQWFVYDSMGRQIYASNPTEISGFWVPTGDDAAWLWTSQTYDWQGRPLKTTNTDNTTRELSYEGCGCAGGQVVTSKDEAGRRQKAYHDTLGRLVKAEVLNWDQSVYSTTVTTYNARDQVINVKEHEGANGTFQETTGTYDGHGRVESRHVPGYGTNRTTRYFYNSDDTIQEVRDPRNASTFPIYNGRHLTTSITYGVLTGSDIPVTPPVGFGYDEAGNRTSMTDGAGGTVYEYDTWSRLFRETRTFAGLGAYVLNYTYNLDGSVKTITDTAGGNVSYTHDSAGQLTAVGGTSNYAAGFQYRAWGATKGLTYGNGLTLNVAFNNRLQTSLFEIKEGATRKFGWEYRYTTAGSNDNDGRVKFSDDLIDNNFDRGFVFDHAGRLTRGTTGGEARGEPNPAPRPYIQTYGYDSWNNMVARSSSIMVIVNGTPQQGAPTNYSAAYVNNRNQAWTYDFAGNVRSGDGQDFTFDAAGRRTVAQPSPGVQGTQFSMVFDGDGHEVKHGEGGTTTYYLRSSVLGKLVVADINASGARIRGYVYAGASLLATEDSVLGVSWRHDDPTNTSNRTTGQNGSLSSLVQLDPLGVKVEALIAPPPGVPSPPGYYGNPFSASMGCRLDGAPAPCSMVLGLLGGHLAIPCPPGGCGPVPVYNAETGEFIRFDFFRAFPDRAGYLPFNAVYGGNGTYDLPEDPEDEESGGEGSLHEVDMSLFESAIRRCITRLYSMYEMTYFRSTKDPGGETNNDAYNGVIGIRDRNTGGTFNIVNDPTPPPDVRADIIDHAARGRTDKDNPWWTYTVSAALAPTLRPAEKRYPQLFTGPAMTWIRTQIHETGAALTIIRNKYYPGPWVRRLPDGGLYSDHADDGPAMENCVGRHYYKWTGLKRKRLTKTS